MRIRSATSRYGAALIMALVAMAIITIVLAAMTAQIVAQRQAVRQRQRQLQTEWLMRAGAELAAARLLQRPDSFSDDQQQFAPDSKVRVVVEKSDGNRYLVTVDATVGQNEGRPVARSLSTSFRRSEKDGVVRLETLPATKKNDKGP
jgi:type II secretory pathway pseudopilin PulG